MTEASDAMLRREIAALLEDCDEGELRAVWNYVVGLQRRRKQERHSAEVVPFEREP
jgi:hypothetical protein